MPQEKSASIINCPFCTKPIASYQPGGQIWCPHCGTLLPDDIQDELRGVKNISADNLNVEPQAPNNLICPHCGKQAMGLLRKLFLGPGRSVACQNCGRKVSVPWFMILPTLFLFFLVGVLGSSLIRIVAGLALFVFLYILSMTTRLVKR